MLPIGWRSGKTWFFLYDKVTTKTLTMQWVSRPSLTAYYNLWEPITRRSRITKKFRFFPFFFLSTFLKCQDCQNELSRRGLTQFKSLTAGGQELHSPPGLLTRKGKEVGLGNDIWNIFCKILGLMNYIVLKLLKEIVKRIEICSFHQN